MKMIRPANIRHYPKFDLSEHLNTDHANLPTIGEVGQAIADARLDSLSDVPNTSYIHALHTWGHSFMDMSAGADPFNSPYQIPSRLFSALGISWPYARDYAAAGSTITGDWKGMFRTSRPAKDNWGDISWQAKFVPQAFLFGANDVGQNGNPMFENGRFLTDWENAWRGVFSYFRAGAIHSPDYIYGGTAQLPGPQGSITQNGLDGVFPGGKAGVTYSGTPNVTWAPTSSLDYVSVGSVAHQTTATTGATISVRLPPLFPGTPVTLYFAGEVGQTGSTNGSITHGGTSPASPISLVTNDRVRTPSTYLNILTPVVPTPHLLPVRILGIPAGDGTTSQTITVNAGTLAAGHKLTFLGWSIEAVHPPILAAANVPTAQSWASGILNTDNIPGNDDGSYVGSGTVPLHWCSYPQSNSVQSIPGGPAFGARNGPHEADSWIDQYYNPTMTSVAAEFEPLGSVAIADLGTVMNGVTFPELWGRNWLGSADTFHPNGIGQAVIAEEFLVAMNREPLPIVHLTAMRSPDDSAEAAAMISRSLG